MSKSKDAAMENGNAPAEVIVRGWNMSKFEGEAEPRILDVELAERLGYTEPRRIRTLIKRLHESGKIPGVLTANHMVRYESRPGVWQEREVTVYYLDERNALRVIRRCETDPADAVMDEVIDVYLALRHGKLATTPLEQWEMALAAHKQLVSEVATVREQVADVVSITSNLDRRLDQERREREQSILRSQQSLYEAVADRRLRRGRQAPPEQLHLPDQHNVTVIGPARERELAKIRHTVAYSLALRYVELQGDVAEQSEVPALLTWADGLLQSMCRSQLEITGRLVVQPSEYYHKVKDFLKDERTKEAVLDSMSSRSIPDTYVRGALWAKQFCEEAVDPA
jgi:hypothetical protein